MITVLVKAAGHGAEHAARRVVRRHWSPDLHPRDEHGRFIETGGTVRLRSGVVGRVVGHAGGRVQVRAGGHVVNAAARSVEVVPPGTPSTPHAPAAAPTAHAAARHAEPTTVAHATASDENRFGTLDRFLSNLPIMADPHLRNEARADELRGKIRVSTHFMSRPDSEKRAVLAHEAAHLHKLDDWYLKNHEDWDLAKRVDFGHLNGHETPGEVIVDAYATLWTEPEFLEQHAPTLIPLVVEGAKAVGLPLPKSLPDGRKLPEPPTRPESERTKLTQVRARDLNEGDRAMLTHPVTGELAPGTIVERRDQGDRVELDVRRADGNVDTAELDRSEMVHRVDSDVEPEQFPDEVDTEGTEPAPPIIPKPTPPGMLIARPPLYTYQRQKIVALQLDRDKSQPPAVRQAAAMARLKLPMTADQATALADAVQLAAARDGLTRPQRRALGRISYRLQATAAEIHGSGPPEFSEGRKASVSTLARDLTEGDTVALAAHDGGIDVVHVRGMTSAMGGRVITLDLEHQDGTRETRVVTGRTKSWLLPDQPDDEPVPPPGDRREHITPDRLRIGDTITARGSTGVVSSIAPEENDGYHVQFSEGEGWNARLTGVTIRSHDGGPAVIRTVRGPASQDQPWDQVMQPEHPQVVQPSELRVGDRITVPGRYGITTTGVIQDLDHTEATADDGTPGVHTTIREDDGPVTSLVLFDHDPQSKVTRLIQSDGNTAAQIEAERAKREGSQRARSIRAVLEDTLNGQRGDDFHRLNMTITHESDEVLKQTMAGARPAEFKVKGDAAKIRRLILPRTGGEGAADAERLAEQRIVPVLREIAARQHDNFVQSLLAATAGISINDPDASQRIIDARRRVLEQWRTSPPPVDTIEISKALAAIADVMQDAPGGTEAAGRPDMPTLPEGANLADRVAAYRQALPAPENIGKQQVTRHMFAQPTLADLEAGKVPTVQSTVIGVPDRAEDGGPGHVAMRHLDIVMAAGHDLDAELQRRATAILGITPERQARSDAAAARIKEIITERDGLWKTSNDASDKARDEFAREHGFRNFSDLRSKTTLADLPDRERLRKLMADAGFAGAQASGKIMERRAALNEEKMRLEATDLITDKTRADAQRQAAREVLREVRPDGVGGVQLTYQAATGKTSRPILTERSELVKAMRFAESHYPTSWLTHARDRGTLTGNADSVTGTGQRVYRLGKIGRGHYQDGTREIRLSKDGAEKVTGGGDRGRVATHELGHAMEQAVPGVMALQHAWLWSRTSSGDVGSREREKKTRIYNGEYGYKDELPEHYTGKDYGSPADPNAFEVLTTGMESLFAGSAYLDDNFRRWLLGTLATV